MGPAGGCNRRSEISASAEDETGVTGVGGCLALLQVQRQPAGVEKHLALLAWDVGAHVPGLRAREQSRPDQFGDMVAPGFLRFRRRLDPAEVVTPHVLDARDDEVTLQLGAGRPVAERRRALRAVDIEQIREVRARYAQMRARAAGPFLTQRLAVGAASVDAGQAAREEIEPRRQYENVELHFPVLRLDTRRRHSFDWGLEQVDNMDVRLIVRLVVVLLQGRPLNAERMQWLHRCKLLRDGGILDPRAHLVAPERIGGIVDLLVAQHVLVRAEPKEETAPVPQLLVRRQPFPVGNIERVLRNEIIVEPGEGLGALEEALGKSLLHPPVGLVVELPLPHWQRQVRRALEHRELGDVLVNLLDDLHPARPGADDADALALEVHAFLRPQAGMVADAAEVLQPPDRRNIWFRGEPRAEHEELRPRHAAVAGLHDPLVAIRVELCTRDAGVEPDVAAQTELLVDVAEIGAKLLPRRIELAEVPIPPKLLAGELIQWLVRIDPGARIAVPVPDAADVGPGLEYLHVVTELAQVIELVEAGEPGADHQHV